ncbi:hypothetical protein [Amycolatopsis speibonae]|uniref:Uncharacterized protein n=1 Tax=Amycolatopsis speibonae TaxID=1450224 RepID=A0ABV7P6S0_9PSEU
MPWRIVLATPPWICESISGISEMSPVLPRSAAMRGRLSQLDQREVLVQYLDLMVADRDGRPDFPDAEHDLLGLLRGVPIDSEIVRTASGQSRFRASSGLVVPIPGGAWSWSFVVVPSPCSSFALRKKRTHYRRVRGWSIGVTAHQPME